MDFLVAFSLSFAVDILATCWTRWVAKDYLLGPVLMTGLLEGIGMNLTEGYVNHPELKLPVWLGAMAGTAVVMTFARFLAPRMK